MDNLLLLAYLLIAVGLMLLFAELVIPTGGILMGVSVLCVLAGVFLTFYSGDPYLGLATMAGVFVLFPFSLVLFKYLWPKTPLGRQAIQTVDPDATVAAMPVNVELEQLRGRYGRAVSPLRPSGVVEFDGRRIDVMSEGIMVDADTWVRCIEVKSGKVIVRPVEKPDLGDLERADFS
jgi:membrane-bound serine protease (ClpP class)